MIPNITKLKSSHLWLLLIIAIFSGSLGPICVRQAFLYDMPSDVITSLRMIFTVFVFTPFVVTRYHRELRAIQPHHLMFALFAGGMFGLNIVLMVTSLEHIGVMINQVLVGSAPIWVALLEVSVLKFKLNKWVWLGITVAFSGGTIIALSASGEPAIVEGGNATYGVIFALLSALGASIYIISGRKLRADIPFLPYVWLVYVGGAVVTFGITLVNQTPMTGYDPQGYFWVIMLAILAQIITHGSMNFVLGYLPATTVTVAMQSVPILSAIWAFLLFSEIPMILQIVGSAVIIIGVTIVIRGQSRPKKKPR